MKCNNCNTEILSTFFYCPSCGKCTRIDTPKQVKNTDSNASVLRVRVQTPQPIQEWDKKDFDLLPNFKLRKDVNEPMKGNRMSQAVLNKRSVNPIRKLL